MKWKAVVDRIEGDMVVVLVGKDEEQILIPRKLLPKVSEGEHLTATWELDPQATAEAKERVADLLRKILND